jgi:hypothetical protein
MSNRVSVGLPKVTPRGQQGNWLIAVNIPGYGELQLPCAHNRFIKGVELQYSREEDVEVARGTAHAPDGGSDRR